MYAWDFFYTAYAACVPVHVTVVTITCRIYQQVQDDEYKDCLLTAYIIYLA